MSSIVVEVAEIEKILPHPGADRLCLAQIKGWQSVIRKNDDGSPQFAVGEKVVFIPPSCTLPREMAEKLNVVTYLSERTNLEGNRELVVRQVRLRGEPSFGLLIRPDDPSWPVGHDVREHYGIGKYKDGIQSFLSSQAYEYSDKILPGQVANQLTATCVGSALTLSVNGTQLARATDQDFADGQTGLIAGTFELEESPVDIRYDTLVVTQP